MFREVAPLAARGWKLVRLYGVTDAGLCTCGKPRCNSAGKHPIGYGWPSRATDNEDEILRWLDSVSVDRDDTRINLGVRLGPSSGIIDVEFDTPEGKAAIEEYGLDQIDTPAYSSGRSIHRIFQYEDWMPPVGVVMVRGIEVRIGGGSKGEQSVLPPSRHHSGKQYTWLPGKSPEEVAPARLPRVFREAIIKASPKGSSGIVRQARESLETGRLIGEGERHAHLLGWACEQTYRTQNLDAPGAETAVYEVVHSLNQTKCQPPKPDEEVRKIVADVFTHYRRARAKGDLTTRYTDPDAQMKLANLKHPLEEYGLQVTESDGTTVVEPGKWRLTIIESVPAEYRLWVYHPRSGEMIPVRIGPEEWLSPTAVARQILSVTNSVDVTRPTPAFWQKVWAGFTVKGGGGRSVEGLKSQLMRDEFCEYESPEPEMNRHMVIASALLGELARPPNDIEASVTKPNPSGLPKWIWKDGKKELWFAWQPTWKRVAETSGLNISPSEQSDMGRRVRESVSEKKSETINQRCGQATIRYHRWTERHMQGLEEIAGGREDAAGGVRACGSVAPK